MVSRAFAWLEALAARCFPTSRHCAAAVFAIALVYAIVLAVFKALPLNDALTFAIALWAMFYLLERCAPRTRALTLYAIVQVIVLCWVFHLWTLGYEGRSAVFGGILPWSDSRDYYQDALRLIHGNPLVFGAKRPLFPVTLAALLRVFDGNLRIPLILFAVFGAWAVALAVNAVWRTHGKRAAFVVCAILLLSERHWAGFIQTEGIGFPLGLIGFTLIWRTAQETNLKRARLLLAAGLLAITIGLMARAGAFFILPALVIWGAVHLCSTGAGLRARFGVFVLASLAIMAGCAVHESVFRLTANGMSFSDYPAIAFGLIHHRDFTFLAEMHPQLNALCGYARAVEAWRIVGTEAALHPLQLLAELARSFLELFITPNGLFGFVWRNPDDIILENGPAVREAFAQYGLAGPFYLWVKTHGVYSLLNAIAMAAFAIIFVVVTVTSLVALYRGRGDRFTTLLRFAVAGILLSAPFTPPWITGSHQVQTVTLAFLAAVPATWRIRWPSQGESLPLPLLATAPFVFAVALTLSAVALVAAPVRAPRCAPGCHLMRVYPSTIVRGVPTRTLNLQDRRLDDLRFSISYLKRHNRKMTDSITPALKNGTVYVFAYDAAASKAKLLVDETGVLNLSSREWQRIDAAPLADPGVLQVRAAGRR